MSIPVPPDASFSKYEVYRGDEKVTPLVTQLAAAPKTQYKTLGSRCSPQCEQIRHD